MADHHDASPRKRKRAPIEESQSKKPKLNLPPRPPRTRFPLTRDALRELNRRNKEAARSALDSKPKRPGSPVPRPAAAADLPARSASDLERFARHGGPDLSDLRGYHVPAVIPPMSSSVSTLRRRVRSSGRSRSRTATDSATGTTPTSTSSARCGPYDHAFQAHLLNFDVYLHPQRVRQRLPAPDNLDEIRRALAQGPRRSLSPSRSLHTEFEEFELAHACATNERMVTEHVIPKIQGKIGDIRCMGMEVPFNNLDHLTDGSIADAKPDYYYGALLEQLDERVRTELAGSIIPSTQLEQPILPNFFLEVKGPVGSEVIVQRQACYNGALGARGMQHLISYGASELVYDNKAYTLTCTYQTGTLKMYTAHVMPPAKSGGRSRYVTTLVTGYSLEGGPDMYRAALTAYRNGRDWAERQRNEAIEHANMKAQVALAGVGTDVGAPAPPDNDDGTPGPTSPGSNNAASSASPPNVDNTTSAPPPSDNDTETSTSSPPPPGGGDNGTLSSATNEASGLRPRRERARASQQDKTPTTRVTRGSKSRIASSPANQSDSSVNNSVSPRPPLASKVNKRRRKGSLRRSRR
ncbi:hypothetical protein GE21DRAFT_33 [Neurospora crassa]|uniref:Uncharacterized protein n=1 Tax=Neurospora crassa (strain ATCC 24698 / 74-OR23-1A / CBS 708.71 / DSM 1257 / FGSC 987) TaxID=367110 RepID=Q7SGL8_NEUCR|nr:hypothetical protein NCU08065 [Neurospora crassa OR74A]EAA35960.2 hypothetical protein NCU08065 [Neurospora crassa OR74A]KHE80643.1 hypothetical protein GE21DRAFT_33 [Neurospora crassa]|eukprot:XP_965196.2 hypothetical protein NCU08065 [Neurospora crassa OR74A]